MSHLAEKTAIITGGAQGLGRGIALELAKAGADIIIADLNTEAAETVVAEINKLGREAIALYLNVTDIASIKDCAQEVLVRFPRIDILVNNAGVMQRGMGTNVTAEDFDLCHNVNVKGVWAVSQAFIPHFKNNGEGKIVNIASVAGRRGHEFATAYCASKAAVISLTQSLAAELGPDNINVNAVCPGIIWTPMWEKIEGMVNETDSEEVINQKETFKANINMTPLRRPQTVDDVGCAVTFLVSSSAKNITGQALNVDGGIVMN